MGPIIVGVILLILWAVLPLPAPIPLILLILGICAILYGIWLIIPRGGPRAEPRRGVRWY
jgi:hypothetical protein